MTTNGNGMTELRAVADRLQLDPPRSAELVGEVMVQSCEAAAKEVEALARAAHDATQQFLDSADTLAVQLREQGQKLRQDAGNLLTSLRDTTAEFERRRLALSAGLHQHQQQAVRLAGKIEAMPRLSDLGE